MSFQDVGRPSAGRRPQNNRGLAPIRESTSGLSTGGLGVGGGKQTNASDLAAAVSNGILQYQRNVGILEKIVRSIGTKAEGPMVGTQYKVQVDVIHQLGAKIEKQLKDQERNMESMPRAEAARGRATHIKLNRDYRRVETNFKNLQLESRRKRSLADARRRELEEEDKRKQFENDLEGESARLQLQLQEDKINEEIMREREEEIRNINKGMHQVNEIYKDLAHIVGSQQEQIDEVEDHMEEANKNAEDGLKNIQKANEKGVDSNCVIS